MKKISILGIALFAAVFCRCSDELEESGAVPAGQNTLTATIDGIQSRTSVAADGKGVLWSKSDAIGVYTTGGNFVEYALQSGDGEKTAVFSAKTNLNDGEEPLYAVYPYDKVDASADQTQYGRFQMTIPPTMDYTTCSNGPMFAFVKGNTISFTHMAGLLKISMNSIPDNAGTVKIETGNIYGLFNIYYNDKRHECPILEKANEGVNRSELTITLPTDPGITEGDLFIPLAVGTHSNLKVSFYDVDDNLLDSRSKTTSFTVGRGEIYAMAEINVAEAVKVSTPEEFYAALTDKSDIKVTAAITLDKNVELVNTSKITFAVAPTIKEGVKFVKGNDCTIKSFTLVYPYGVAESKDSETTLNIELEGCKVYLQSTDERDETYRSIKAKMFELYDNKELLISKVSATVNNVSSVYLGKNVCLDKLTVTGSGVNVSGKSGYLIRMHINAGSTVVYDGGSLDDSGFIDPDNENWWITGEGSITSGINGRSTGVIVPSSAKVWDGKSSSEPILLNDIYLITNGEELAWFMSKNPPTAAMAASLPVTMDKSAKLLNHINLNNHPWVGAVIKNAEFDGNGKTIYNLNIKQFVMNQQGTIYTPDACVGLFAAAYQDAKIKNITLEGVTITCTVGSPKWVGSLVGYSYGATAYINCVAKNVNINMTGGTSYRVGGLIGYIEGFHKSNNPASVVLTGCEVNTATIAATFSYGGLVGSMYDSATFSTCKTSNITLRLNDSPWNYGYVSKFIGDIANSVTSYNRTILINSCTADDLTNEEKDYLQFDKVVAEQNSSFLKGTYLGNCPWCGLVEPVAGVLNDGKFVIKVDENTLVNGKDFNVCQ